MRWAKVSSSASNAAAHLPAAEPQQAAHLRRVGEVGEGAQIGGPLRLSFAVAAGEASSPRPAAPPRHGNPFAPVQVVELDIGLLHRIGRYVLLPAGEVRKQGARGEVACRPSGHVVRAGAGEQHGRLAAAVRSGEDADRIVEREAEVPDAAQLLDADFRQRLVALPLAGAQRVPDLMQLPRHQRHGQLPRRRRAAAVTLPLQRPRCLRRTGRPVPCCPRSSFATVSASACRSLVSPRHFFRVR